ncbi:hypothetical protein OVA14_08090 [Agrococcus sp. SL85]|uniref:hypothetical protein n=1 Tax=Agrococcus sp. SL85 TaxID=2995141 RepID=UPI00226CFC51|nr:hypothetical protein [Agrococcus sp. SL85]WAC65339.1 hypothetical protein OVA14_08090 [Agrococcus sp. SL85]
MLGSAQLAGSSPLPFDPDMVTPGVIGFLATVAVAVVVMLLMWDFNRRVRRINDRAEIKERIALEVAEREAAERAAAAGQPEAVAGELAASEPTAVPDATDEGSRPGGPEQERRADA